MKFRSYYHDYEAGATCAGNTTRKTYKRKTNTDGSWTIVEDGDLDIQKMINSACPPSIANILQHARRGDTTLLNAKTGAVYEDVSQIHGDFGDILALSKRNVSLVDKARKVIAEREKNAKNEVKEGDANALA